MRGETTTVDAVAPARRAVSVLLLAAWLAAPLASDAQNRKLVWSGVGRDAQHTALAMAAAQPLAHIRWQTPVDLQPQYSWNELFIHYGSPLLSSRDTVIVPVKIGTTDGFQVEGRNAADGTLVWTLPTDYTLPPHGWVPSFGPALGRMRLWVPAAGGTVYRRTRVDAPAQYARVRRIAFYGTNNYEADPGAYQGAVFINTPLTADRHGIIYFGFEVTGATPLDLQSGIARLTNGGHGRWVGAAAAAGDPAVMKVAHNSAPAVSNDGSLLYVAVNESTGSGGSGGYLLALDSRTLATISKVRLKDPSTGNDALLFDDGTSSPTVGPDGDVYFGVLENPLGSHHLRGWLLHFDGGLRPTGSVGSFGWDDTVSIVPATMVPSYGGGSSYLLMTKYNNYVEGGGDGVNRIAVLDPNATMTDPIAGIPVMAEVLTVAGPTPDPNYPDFPNAVREWCINTAAVDPLGGSILANNEDGKLYRWDLVSNTLSESIVLTPGIGEAYTPTLVGADGTVYAINNATLFAVGN